MGGIVYRKSEGNVEHLIIVAASIRRHRIVGSELVYVEDDLCPIETAELLQREQDDWTLDGETYRTVVTRWREGNEARVKNIVTKS